MLKDVLGLVLSLVTNFFSASAAKRRVIKALAKEYREKIKHIDRAVAGKEDPSVVLDDIAHPADIQLPDEKAGGNPGK